MSASTRPGASGAGSVRAETSEAARDQLVRRKLYVVRIEAAAEAARRRLCSRAACSTRRKLAVKQVTLFTRQLATLIQVSPLEEALRTISRQAEREEVRRVLGNVHSGVVEGRRLSEAMGARAGRASRRSTGRWWRRARARARCRRYWSGLPI